MDRVTLEDEYLKVSVSSKSLAQKLSSLLLDIAVTQIEYFEHLVAVQEVLNHLEHLEICRNVVLGDVKLSNFVIGLEAYH